MKQTTIPVFPRLMRCRLGTAYISLKNYTTGPKHFLIRIWNFRIYFQMLLTCCKAKLWDEQNGEVRTLMTSINHWLLHILDFYAILSLEMLSKWHFLIVFCDPSCFRIFVPIDAFKCVSCSLFVVGCNFSSNQSSTNNSLEIFWTILSNPHDLIPETINAYQCTINARNWESVIVHLQLKSLMTFLPKPNFKPLPGNSMRLIMRLIRNAISLRVWSHCKLVWKIRQPRKFGRKLNKKRRTRPFLVIVKNSVLHTLLYYKPLFSIPFPVPNNRLLVSLFTVVHT